MKLLNAIHKYDVFMFSWLINASIHNHLVRSCRKLSKTGDGGLHIIVMVLMAWREGAGYPPLLAMLLAFAVERPLYFILKNSFKRNRPQESLIDFRSVIKPSDQFSFPSGHTSAAFLMATLLSHYYPQFTIPLFAWAGLIGFSRVALGVHFPTDIFVGALMGISVAIFSIGNVN